MLRLSIRKMHKTQGSIAQNDKRGPDDHPPPPFRPERRAWRDSNPRPSDSKSAALSAELQARAYYVTDYSAEQSEGQDQPRVEQDYCTVGRSVILNDR
jgi:hypothetical protein